MEIVDGSRTDKIVSEIRARSAEHSRLIVAIDGYSGSGKTSILNRIKNALPIVCISLDSFVYEFSSRRECVDKSQFPEIEFSHCWYRFDELIEVLGAFRANRGHASVTIYDYELKRLLPHTWIDLSPNILVVEGAFISERLRERNMADYSIFVLSDLSKADKRRERRERARWREAYQNDDHPDSYVQAFKNAFQYYLTETQVLQNSDLLILN